MKLKLNTFLIAAACAGTLLATSCSPSANEKQLKYTHTTLVDGDAYQFFQIVGEKVPYEIGYAAYVEGTSTSAQIKTLAGTIREEFASILPDLNELAADKQVDFPIRGAQAFVSPDSVHAVVNTLDTTQAVTQAQPVAVNSDEDYLNHAKLQLAEIKKQFKRLSRNTDKDLRDYAASKLETIDELYQLAGGKLDAHAHH